jgi:ATP-binding cassette subfamily B protein
MVSGLLEVISLGAVLPFIMILINPDKILSYQAAQALFDIFEINSKQQLTLIFATIFITAALFAGIVRLIFLWASTRFSMAIGADISAEIFKRTLYQSYPVHLKRNSSIVFSGITQKAGAFTSILFSLLILISAIIMTLSTVVTLFLIDPQVTSAAVFALSSAYLFIGYIVKARLIKNSEQVATAQPKAIKIVQEGLGGIRDVLLTGSQSIYCHYFHNADRMARSAQASTQFLAGAPRLTMETICVVLFISFSYFISNEPGGIAEALPTLGALALGAQRLLPALQQSYAAWAAVKGNQIPVLETVDMLDQPMPNEFDSTSGEFTFENKIQLDSIRFRYNDLDPWILEDFSLEIKKGDRVGIIGSTGSGKSTILDILMGLLQPTEGVVLVDGKVLTGELTREWQRSLAHVPQAIYLADSSIAENIAFGQPRHLINMERVKGAASAAMISEFIEALPKGYDASVGERGVRLSGGERQRIGIARALYRKAQLLILDEATSALDNWTEQDVMRSITRLGPEVTILIIAHRLSTLRNCNLLAELKNGRVVLHKSHSEIIARCNQ